MGTGKKGRGRTEEEEQDFGVEGEGTKILGRFWGGGRSRFRRK